MDYGNDECLNTSDLFNRDGEEASKKLFHANVGVGSWFSQLIQASKDFTIEGRIVWVEIEGWVPDFLEESDDEHDSDDDVNEGDLMQLDSDGTKRAAGLGLWDEYKAPGPDGFTFGFYRRFWKVESGWFYVIEFKLGMTVVDRVLCSPIHVENDDVSIGGRLESIRSHFFNGHDPNSKRTSWVKWKNVLASKMKGGTWCFSLYALIRGLMFKWVVEGSLLKIYIFIVEVYQGDLGEGGGGMGKWGKQCESLLSRGLDRHSA
ncbi:hypothetical protein Tco_1004513 [Tanacetum coccineum]|uniref:Uncharacterized protein n=1 Tax=Tanacetum coccineum TaxID=301880 RepID=A0ABQ5FCE5_9ASTR